MPKYEEVSQKYPSLNDKEIEKIRLGVILPSVNTVVEPWFSKILPENASLHASRMFLSANLSPESLIEMDRCDGVAAALHLKSCKPKVIAYCCTASSIVQGQKYDQHLMAELSKITEIPCFSAAGAIIDALESLDISRISIVSPYTDIIDHAEHQFFEEAGYKVLSSSNLGIEDSYRLAEPSTKEIYDLAIRGWKSGSEALLISCLNMNSQKVVEMLENVIGCPVITSTTATLWKLMREAGLYEQVPGYGYLLGKHR